MIHVIFVCKGNICRSPMAEAIFRKKVQDVGLANEISVDSAGTGNWHIGNPPHPGTIEMLKQHSIPHEDLIARQIQPEDLQKFNYIVVMDEQNMAMIRNLGNVRQQMFRLLELVPSIPENNVPDPYYDGQFDRVYEWISLGCDALLEKIQKDHHLDTV
ncbi:low molecular weight phosphotyrosine protein phosphatase [Fodinisporobacter ferrooxydans]|uniref:protein-tyrosine-phosphatase n=1 Tax=Fodinisporobacter ferrooxydans TaxID=2901836 RepID=A0ABY4CQ86_9BACL|nr:low molecular weight phosphotyrosine protein phosphatase [Alicyclobacillaceae bacterium MYW30-H2]